MEAIVKAALLGLLCATSGTTMIRCKHCRNASKEVVSDAELQCSCVAGVVIGIKERTENSRNTWYSLLSSYCLSFTRRISSSIHPPAQLLLLFQSHEII